MAYIYKITNLKNGKVYIGKTLNTIEERFKQHCSDSKKESCKNRPLYRAFNKYGIENFKVEEVEECSYKEASKREIFWIEYYNSFHDGYNATIGGDGKQFYDYSLIYENWKQGKTIRQISTDLGMGIDTVKNALNEYKVSDKEIQQRANLSTAKKVYMIDLKTNKIIKSFDSLGDAARFLGKHRAGGSHISAVCKGERKTAYGYKWKYAD